VAEFADHGFEQIYMHRRAFFDDDLANSAVIENLCDVIIAGQQGLRAKVQLGIDLNGLGFGFL
jgi:hypothetical protein